MGGTAGGAAGMGKDIGDAAAGGAAGAVCRCTGGRWMPGPTVEVLMNISAGVRRYLPTVRYSGQ